MAKPTSKPDWTVGNGSFATVTVEPSAPEKVSGWAVNQRPPRQFMNWLFYNIDLWIKYFNTIGVTEWDTTTTYQLGTIVNVSGVLYRSLANANLNNAVTDVTKWINVTVATNVITVDPSTQSPYTLTAAHNGATFLVKSNLGAMTFNLPAPALNYNVTIKDRDGNFETNPCTLVRNGSETIEALAASFIMYASFGAWLFLTDGTNWSIGE